MDTVITELTEYYEKKIGIIYLSRPLSSARISNVTRLEFTRMGCKNEEICNIFDAKFQ